MQFGAFRIPPQASPEAHGSPLGELVGVTVRPHDGEMLRAMAAAIRGADTALLQSARANIHYSLMEIEAQVGHHDIPQSALVNRHGPVAADILSGSVLDLGNDCETALKEVDRSPRSKRSQALLAKALRLLAEASVFTRNAAASVDPALADTARLAASSWARLAPDVARLRADTAKRYPDLSTNVPDPAEIMARAERDVAGADLSTPRITPRMMSDALGACGDRRAIYSAKGRNEERFLDHDAKMVRQTAPALLEAYDSVFNDNTFVGELRKAAVSLAFRSKKYVGFAIERTESSIRLERRGLYQSAAEHKREIASNIADLPKRRASVNRNARTTLGWSLGISNFLEAYQRAVHPDRPGNSAFIKFEVRDGALVGVPDRGGMDAFVVYDDTVVRAGGNHPCAVYAVRMPVSAVENGVPPLEEVREARFSMATNYHSLEECLNEIDGVIEQRLFFDGIDVTGHDAVEALAAGGFGYADAPVDADYDLDEAAAEARPGM